MENNYRILLKIGESSFEIESTDADWIGKKEKEYLDRFFKEGAPKHQGKRETEPTRQVLPHKMTLNEFYRKYISKIKSRSTIAVFFVYYLQKIQNKEKIKTVDVINCFKEIGYPGWSGLNITDILSGAKRRVYPYPLSRHKTGLLKVDPSPCIKAVGTEGARRATGVPTATPYTSAGVW